MNLRYLLDTNICIYISKRRPLQVLERFKQLAPGEVGMSLVTYGELYYGAQKSQQRELALEKLSQLAAYIPVITPDIQTAVQYGTLRAT